MFDVAASQNIRYNKEVTTMLMRRISFRGHAWRILDATSLAKKWQKLVTVSSFSAFHHFAMRQLNESAATCYYVATLLMLLVLSAEHCALALRHSKMS